MSTFTVNKNIQQPASGSFNNAWAAPVNADWEDIDNAFGGHAVIDVTGASGAVALMISQYQPPQIEFTGTLSAAVTYVLPAGVGGIWTLANGTTGSFALNFGISGGNFMAVAGGNTTLVASNGSFVGPADSAGPASAVATSEAFATAADTVVLSSANATTTAAVAAERSTAANASNLSSGTVPNAQLPNIGLMPGVIIQADPGGTPTGAPGTIWLYY